MIKVSAPIANENKDPSGNVTSRSNAFDLSEGFEREYRFIFKFLRYVFFFVDLHYSRTTY